MSSSTNHTSSNGTTNSCSESSTAKPSVPQPRASTSDLPFSQQRSTTRPQQSSSSSSTSITKDQILIVGDSIAHNANFRVAEIATNTTITTAKAYAADYDLNTLKPNNNVKYVARNKAKPEKFKCVLLHSPSVHITNLDTRVDSDESRNYFKKVVENSAKKMV